MKQTKWIFIMAIAAFCLLLLFWQSHKKTVKTAMLSGHFLENGTLLVEGIGEAAQVKILDSHNTLVAIKQSFGNDSVTIQFPWQINSPYQIVADNQQPLIITSPTSKPEFVIRLHLPTGQKPHEFYLSHLCEKTAPLSIPFPIPQKGEVDMMLEVEKLTNQGTLHLDLSSRIEDASTTQTISNLSQQGVALTYEFENKIWLTKLKAQSNRKKRLIKMAMKTDHCHLQFDLHLLTHHIDRNLVEIDRWQLPTDNIGLFSTRHTINRLVMPNKVWQRLGILFGIAPKTQSYFDPFSYQALTLTNRSQQPVSFVLKSEILDLVTNQPVSHFNAPNIEKTGGTGEIIGFVDTQAGQSVRAVLPLFVEPDVKAGTYLRKISIFQMGNDTPIKVIEEKLFVERSNHFYTLWVLLIIAISVIWALILVLFYRKLVTSLGVRLLVLLSLLGSLQFGLSFVSTIVSGIFYGILGPFNCLVGGLFSEVMVYLITTAILILVPRVGAITVAGLIAYLMRSVMLGSFGLTDILFIGSAIAFKELFLYLFGITKFKPVSNQSINLVALMIALGLADAAATYTSLILHSVFYRLFFADWYFVLQVGITGFLYTTLGVYLGHIMGKNLRKVHI